MLHAARPSPFTASTEITFVLPSAKPSEAYVQVPTEF